jgi:hypothetical protein
MRSRTARNLLSIVTGTTTATIAIIIAAHAAHSL